MGSAAVKLPVQGCGGGQLARAPARTQGAVVACCSRASPGQHSCLAPGKPRASIQGRGFGGQESSSAAVMERRAARPDPTSKSASPGQRGCFLHSDSDPCGLTRKPPPEAALQSEGGYASPARLCAPCPSPPRSCSQPRLTGSVTFTLPGVLAAFAPHSFFTFCFLEYPRFDTVRGEWPTHCALGHTSVPPPPFYSLRILLQRKRQTPKPGRSKAP